MQIPFVFNGFEPTTELRNFAATKLNQIFEESPSDATPFARLIKRSDGFEAVLKICSEVGIFTARVISDDPRKAVDELYKKINLQLREWKKIRFLPA